MFMKSSIRLFVLWSMLCYLSQPLLRSEDWRRFRGPNGSGVSDTAGLPAEFSSDNNLVWATEVPFGRSSPILVGDYAFLTAFEDGKLVTLCLRRETGEVVWRGEIAPERSVDMYKSNDPASPTPVSDGKDLYVFFPDLGLISFGLAGTERWRRSLGPFNSFYGMGASPILAGDAVLLVCDQQSGSFLIAVDKVDGRVLWRVERPVMTESWTTPVLYTPEGRRTEVVVFGSLRVDAYSVESGERQWWYSGVGSGPISSPVLNVGKLFVNVPNKGEGLPPPYDVMLKQSDANRDGLLSRDELDEGFQEHFGSLDINKNGSVNRDEWTAVMDSISTEHYGTVALSIGGKGRLPEARVVWRSKKSVPNISSPLLYKDVLYLIKDGGILTSMDPSTGEIFKRGRVTGALGAYYSSPVAADGKVFLANEEGRVAVLEAGPEWEVVAINDLGEDCYATPAIADGRIYIRTRNALYCFGEVSTSTPSRKDEEIPH